MTWATSNLRVSIWSLINQGLGAFISNPKMLPPKGIDFSENKKFCAIAERKDAKDIVGIYYAGNDWKMVNQLPVDTMDLQDIKWTSGDSAILTWDTALESKILIYSVATGNLLSRFEPDSIGLGIKNLSIAPSKNLFASGMYDGSIVLYNNLTA
jgi:WD40 repeat protein